MKWNVTFACRSETANEMGQFMHISNGCYMLIPGSDILGLSCQKCEMFVNTSRSLVATVPQVAPKWNMICPRLSFLITLLWPYRPYMYW